MNFSISIQGQEYCGTPTSSTPQHFEGFEGNLNSRTTPSGICINVFFHIVRESDGTGGINPANINVILQNLNEAFNPHRIYINNFGVDFIDSSTYYNLATNEFNGLISINNISNAINFYLVNSAPYAGRAQDILSKNLVVVNNSALSPTSPHELGHCLNLWHTHHGRGCDDTNGCTENINGANCSSCGDFVCDTPADPCVLGLIDNNCQYTGGGGFSPDVTNIMSYGGWCRTNFTEGQSNRIRNALLYSSTLQSVVNNNGCTIPKLIGDYTVCNSSYGTTYSLQNGGNSVSWNVSSNLQIISSSNTSITVRPINSSTNGAGYIEAILPLEILFEEVWVGVPLLDYDIYENFTMCRDINSTVNNSFSASIQGYDGSSTWEVQRITNNHTVTMQGNDVVVNLFYLPPYNYIAFKVRASNSCGFSEWLEYYVEVIDNCGTEAYNSFMVYPNPASEILTIKNKKTKLTKNENNVYKLYDYDLKLILEGVLNDQIKINISNYKKGKYILKIFSHQKSETHNIIFN